MAAMTAGMMAGNLDFLMDKKKVVQKGQKSVDDWEFCLVALLEISLAERWESYLVVWKVDQ